MKNYKFLNTKYLVVVLSLLMISLSSCDSEWIDSELNVDPDSPSNVPMSLLLPAVQQSMGYNLLGNNSVRTNNIWTQHFDGTSRQSYTEARYQFTAADVNNLWGSIYTEMFMNLQIIIDKAGIEGSESDNFKGVAQVLQATTLGITTDLFGDIPFSEAFKGSQNILRPEYDTQEKVYDTIFNILDNAVVNLNSTTNVFAIDGDVIYGGSKSKWIKAAHSIKARHYMQLSNVLGNEASTKALAEVAAGFASNADDYAVPFEVANSNPIFQFMEQRTDIRMGATFVDMLVGASDPRTEFYVEEDAEGNFVGSIPGSQNEGASFPGSYVAGETASVYLMTYSELKFIEAEANFRLGNTGDAQDAYEAAVAASVLRVTGAANTEWLDANINGVAVSLGSILTQKYIDGFGTNQPYADYRRTGLPNLDLAQGAVIDQIPTRFPYAQSEKDYNAGNVPNVQLTDKLWWDQ